MTVRARRVPSMGERFLYDGPMVTSGRARQRPRWQDVIGRAAPKYWRILDLEVPIAAGATGAIVLYRWQREVRLFDFQLGVLSGVDADLAGLELSWQDGKGDQVATTGRQQSTIAGFMVSAQQHWQPLAIVARRADVHAFQIANLGANTIVPRLMFHGEYTEENS